jgi:hypothetical protein
MIKSIEKIITQSGSDTETTLTLGTTENILLFSAIVQTSGTGRIAFGNSSKFLFSKIVSAEIIDALESGYPVFSLDKTLKINTLDFANGDIINVIVYYIEGSSTNPLFVGTSKFELNTTTTASIGPSVILSNVSEYIYNIKSIYVYANTTSNILSLLLESPTFTSPVQITNQVTGAQDYQLLESPLLLNPNSSLYLNVSELVSTLVSVSYTRGAV